MNLLVPVVALALVASSAASGEEARTRTAVPIGCGESLDGSIDVVGEEDLFTFSGRRDDDVVVTIVQDGSWPSFPGPEALVLARGERQPLQVVPDSWAFGLFNSNDETGIGPYAEVFSSIAAGTNAGAVRYQAVIGDFPAPPSAIFVQPVLFGAFGAGGTNTLFPGTVPGSPLVPIVNNGTHDDDEGTPVIQGLDAFLSEEQEALLGCGALHFTDCDGAVAPGPDGVLGTEDDALIGGVDLARADPGVLLQSFPRSDGSGSDPSWDTADPTLPQPGTVDAAFNDGPGGGVDSPESVPGELETDPADVPPGAHYDLAAFVDVLANAAANAIVIDSWVIDNLVAHDVSVDGSAGCGELAGCRRHPFTGQLFASEMAVVSWNLLMLATSLGAVDNAVSLGVLDRAQPLALGRCSFRQPQHCAFVSALAAYLTQGGHVKLPRDGTYTILVRAKEPRATGPYALELTCPPSPPWDGRTVCHKGKKTNTFENARTALKHLAHGDTRGECR